MHTLDGGQQEEWQSVAISKPDGPTRNDVGEIGLALQAELSRKLLRALAGDWCTSASTLKQFHIGWASRSEAFSFPMRAADREIIGVQFVSGRTGTSFSMKGSRQGLVMPCGPFADRVLVTECIAELPLLLDMGFTAIGFVGPCRYHLGNIANQNAESEFVLIDGGDRQQRRATGAMEDVLLAYSKQLRRLVVPTGYQNLVDWRRDGGNRKEFLRLISHAEVQSCLVERNARRLPEVHHE